MRIATWNVNSLKARLPKVQWWLERARPDVLLMQETKLADFVAPYDDFRSAGYELVHHGEGRWNGVAIASRTGLSEVTTNFGQPLPPAKTPEVADDEPLAEARMIAGVVNGIRVASVSMYRGVSASSPSAIRSFRIALFRPVSYSTTPVGHSRAISCSRVTTSPGRLTNSSRIWSGWSCRRWVFPPFDISPESKLTDHPSNRISRLSMHPPQIRGVNHRQVRSGSAVIHRIERLRG